MEAATDWIEHFVEDRYVKLLPQPSEDDAAERVNNCLRRTGDGSNVSG
jgi:hypothetical protein